MDILSFADILVRYLQFAMDCWNPNCSNICTNRIPRGATPWCVPCYRFVRSRLDNLRCHYCIRLELPSCSQPMSNRPHTNLTLPAPPEPEQEPEPEPEQDPEPEQEEDCEQDDMQYSSEHMTEYTTGHTPELDNATSGNWCQPSHQVGWRHPMYRQQLMPVEMPMWRRTPPNRLNGHQEPRVNWHPHLPKVARHNDMCRADANCGNPNCPYLHTVFQLTC